MKIYVIDPVGKPRMTRADSWKKRPCVVKYWKFKDKAKSLGLNKELGNALLARYVIKMPKSWSKKKRKTMNGKPHQQKPDIDNIDKAVLDIIPEDSHVFLSFTIKIWGEKGMIVTYNSIQELLEHNLLIEAPINLR